MITVKVSMAIVEASPVLSQVGGSPARASRRGGVRDRSAAAVGSGGDAGAVLPRAQVQPRVQKERWSLYWKESMRWGPGPGRASKAASVPGPCLGRCGMWPGMGTWRSSQWCLSMSAAPPRSASTPWMSTSTPRDPVRRARQACSHAPCTLCPAPRPASPTLSATPPRSGGPESPRGGEDGVAAGGVLAAAGGVRGVVGADRARGQGDCGGARGQNGAEGS